MILAREDMVWVVAPDGQRVPFDANRLVDSIVSVAGDGQCAEAIATVAESIAAAIYQHVRDHLADSCIAADEISEMVEALLEMLGHDQRALAYAIQRRQAEVQLDDLATRGGGLELAFYRELDATLERVNRRPLRRLNMHGLRACVLHLRGAQRWGTGCKNLADDILRHVWARLERMDLRESSVFHVAVVE